ncbi:PAS domain-containing protein [Roseateles sp. BYS96W]|uniref:PAS domain-containing protein n=1 Tax=Pelomonas nitida TaxID=3299027 RepID=A0ABW7GAR9_9BURK
MTPAGRQRWRFALVPALAGAVLTALLLAAARHELAETATRLALARNQQRADLLAQQLQQSLRDAVNQVRLLARSPLLRPGAAPARRQAELDGLVEHSPRFVWAGVVAADGHVLAGSHGALAGQSIAHRPVFREGRDGLLSDLHPVVAAAPAGASTRPADEAAGLIDIGEPVLDDSGAVVAIVTAHLGLGWVREQLALSLGPADRAAADGLQGLVVSSLDGRSAVPGIAVPAGLPTGLGPARLWQDAQGRRWLSAQALLRGGSGETPLLPWRTIVLQSEATVLAPLRAVTLSMAALGLAASLLLAGAGLWLARRLTPVWDPQFDTALAGPVAADGSQVASRVQALLAERANGASPTERLLGWLASDAALQHQALAHLPMAVALADRDYRIGALNPAFTRLLGWTTDTLHGRPVLEPLLENGEITPWARLLHELQAEPGEFVCRLQALTASGTRVPVQCHLVPMFDAPGHLLGALLLVQDLRAPPAAAT